MGTPLVPARHLSPTITARIRHCGAALNYVTPDGVQTGRWSCGSSWCEWCADRRRSRARAIIARRLDESAAELQNLGDVVMVTLSVPHRADYSAAYLRERIELVSQLWRGTMTRIRWAMHRFERGDPHAWERLPAPGRGGPHPVFASTYDGRWHGDCSAGVWVREITTGGATAGWHVHAHVVVPSREDAEMVNAGWQASCESLGVVEPGRWTSTNYRTIPAARAASYIAKYLTKQDVSAIPDHLLPAYIEGSRGMRRCDAWGGWRPLGLGQRDAGDATHVSEPDWPSAVDVALYFGETPLAKWLRTGRPPVHADDWSELGVSMPPVVIALLCHTDDAGLLAESKLAALAVARSIGRAEHTSSLVA